MRLGTLRRRGFAALFAFALAGATGCGGGEETAGASADAEAAAPAPDAETAPADDATTVSAEAREEARKIFESRCYTCHGKQGRGDGPGSSGLDPQPRDLTDPEWQTSVTDEHIERIILYGGAAVGLSPAMPANPDLSGRPDVVAALVEHVRNLSGAESAGTEGGAR